MRPALATPIALDVAEAAPPGFADAEVELLDVGVGQQLAGRPVAHDAPVLHDVAVVAIDSAIVAFCSTSRTLVPWRLTSTMMSRICCDDLRREPERRLVEQQQPR